jgi:hypothetical protein
MNKPSIALSLSLSLSLVMLFTLSQPVMADETATDPSSSMLRLADQLDPNFESSSFEDSSLRIELPKGADTGLWTTANFKTQRGRLQSLKLFPKKTLAKIKLGMNFALASSTDASSIYLANASSSGMRFIARTRDASSSSSITYVTNLDRDSYLLKSPVDGYLILNGDGEYLGNLGQPWAIDASGRRLSTTLRLQNSLLVQDIKIDSGVTYPVTSDPNWSYSLDYTYIADSNGMTVSRSKRTPDQATSKLQSCFNCYFPITGAPKTYPYVGQSMPLRIELPLVPMASLPAPVVVSAVSQNGWTFTATNGHVDGAGSKIWFLWYSDAEGYLHLNVLASIVNPDPCGLGTSVCQSIYPIAAGASWSRLFANVAR